MTLHTSITTERLVLEPMTAAHAPLLFAPLQDARIYTWISSTPPSSVEQLRARWAAVDRRNLDGREIGLNWALRRLSDGTYVGKFDAELTGTIATNVGYLIFPPYWRHGYASEGVRGLVEHLARHDVYELHALVTDGNSFSARVLTHAGFTRERVVYGNDTICGVPHDDIEYVRRGTREH